MELLDKNYIQTSSILHKMPVPVGLALLTLSNNVLPITVLHASHLNEWPG